MTYTVAQIAQAIEMFAPLHLQESYDNCGLQMGSRNAVVANVLVCLSLTEEILEEAISRDCQMIVTHHPLLFKGLKSITGASPTEKMAIKAIRKGISIYSAHTNLDSAKGGVSTIMAKSIGMERIRPLIASSDDAETGLGIIGYMPRPVPAREFLRLVKNAFKVKALRYSSQSPAIVINKVALCGGSGASFINDAINQGADAYISGDIKYHDFDSFGSSVLLIDTGHYESEIGARNLLATIIKESFPNINVVISETEHNPIETI